MNIGQAIDLLKSGHRVSRAGWNGKAMWLCYMPPMQFKRWDAPIPENRADLQRLKAVGENIKDRLAVKLGKK